MLRSVQSPLVVFVEGIVDSVFLLSGLRLDGHTTTLLGYATLAYPDQSRGMGQALPASFSGQPQEVS